MELQRFGELNQSKSNQRHSKIRETEHCSNPRDKNGGRGCNGPPYLEKLCWEAISSRGTSWGITTLCNMNHYPIKMVKENGHWLMRYWKCPAWGIILPWHYVRFHLVYKYKRTLNRFC